MSSTNPVDARLNTYREYSFQTRRGTSNWEVLSRYSLEQPLGEGGYGVVCSAYDHIENKKVAIKKVQNAFAKVLDTKRLLREIKLLRHFHHENILPIIDIMRPPSYEKFNDVYLVTELLDTDLHKVIRKGTKYTHDHCVHFLYLLLRGVKYIHSANVLHRDLKPGNILINQTDCDLKICDFGLARGVSSTVAQASGLTHRRESIGADLSAPSSSSAVAPALADGPVDLTLYVTTRWYRAPEVILNSPNYTKSVDVWSIGCIFAELLGKLENNIRPLFPGRDYADQLSKIIEIIGTPSPDDVKDMGQDQARRYLFSLPRRSKKPFETIYRKADRMAIDLLERMLQFDPRKRITVDEALEHPYLSELHDAADEPICDSLFDFSFEQQPDVNLKNLIWEEMCSFHPEMKLVPIPHGPAAGTMSTLITPVSIDGRKEPQKTSPVQEKAAAMQQDQQRSTLTTIIRK